MKVARWGNSLAVRLPSDLVQSMGISEGDEIVVRNAAPKEIAIMREDSRQRALARIAARRWVLPPDWKIDRNDPDERG
jgi:antitoxin MazE